MNACDRARPDVIDQMAEDDTIHECSPQVLVQADLESHLDALWGNQDVRSTENHIHGGGNHTAGCAVGCIPGLCKCAPRCLQNDEIA